MKALVALLACSFLASSAQTAQVPSPQVLRLWQGAAPHSLGTADADTPTITVFLPAQNPTHTLIVVAPGGGYEQLASDHEGVQVAHWLNERGVAALVLKYRLGPVYHHPVELEDAQRAIRTARSRAADWGADPSHIGMWGFSAGGHLTATAGTHFDRGNASSDDVVERVSSRPDFLVLAYPVITMEAGITHAGSRLNLLGPSPEDATVALLSADQQVTDQTPPTFLFSTTDDNVVPVQNSVLFYSALVEHHVSAEMHIYNHGHHGVGLAVGNPVLSGWPDVLAHWLRENGWMQ